MPTVYHALFSVLGIQESAKRDLHQAADIPEWQGGTPGHLSVCYQVIRKIKEEDMMVCGGGLLTRVAKESLLGSLTLSRDLET